MVTIKTNKNLINIEKYKMFTKFLQKYVYRPIYEKSDNNIIQFVTTWPMCSYMIFLLLRVIILPQEHMIVVDYRKIVLLIIFRNIVFEYIPNNKATIWLKGIGYWCLSMGNVNSLVLGVILGLARRKYSVVELTIYNLSLVSVLYIAYK